MKQKPVPLKILSVNYEIRWRMLSIYQHDIYIYSSSRTWLFQIALNRRKTVHDHKRKIQKVTTEDRNLFEGVLVPLGSQTCTDYGNLDNFWFYISTSL